MGKQPPQPDLEHQLKLQRELTAEVKRTAAAYRGLHTVQATGEPQLKDDLPRYRDPHDHFGSYDRIDRKQAVVMDVARYMLYLPGLKQRTRFVPGRAVAEYSEDDDGQFALVECPCSAKPIVRPTVEKCSGCERYYMLVGKGALVIYGEMTPPWMTDVPEPPVSTSTCPAGRCDGGGFIVDEATNTAYDCPCRPERKDRSRS